MRPTTPLTAATSSSSPNRPISRRSLRMTKNPKKNRGTNSTCWRTPASAWLIDGTTGLRTSAKQMITQTTTSGVSLGSARRRPVKVKRTRAPAVIA